MPDKDRESDEDTENETTNNDAMKKAMGNVSTLHGMRVCRAWNIFSIFGRRHLLIFSFYVDFFI